MTATFSHRFFKPASENPEIAHLNKERSRLKKYWNETERKHDSLFKNNLITKGEYFKLKEKNERARVLSFRGISIKRKSIAHAFSFKGRESFHYWIWIFGIFITLFTCASLLVIKDNRLKKAGLLKWYEPYAAIGFIAVSLFWLYHTVFKTSKDFELNVYTLFLIAILLPVSYFVYHFLRRGFVIEEKLLQNIRDLVGHTLKNTKPEKEKEMWNVLEKVADNGK